MKINNLILILLFVTACHYSPINKLVLHIESSNKDNVQIFVNNSYTANYNEQNSITKKVSEGGNIIEFDLTNFSKIKSVRIDLGDAKIKRNIALKSVKFYSNNHVREVKGKDLTRFFEGNKEVILDSVGFHLKDSIATDPFIISKNLGNLF